MNTENHDPLGRTTAYCGECRTSHPARYEDDRGKVMYAIDCPQGPKKTLVSSDLGLFSGLRAYETLATAPASSGKRRFRFYLITLTERCNFECPICYAEAGPYGQAYRSLEQVRELAIRIKADGGRRVSLSGGEPTLHPQLPEIVRMVRYDFGLAPVLVTNGLRLSEDPEYARTLKAAGLRSVHMQFDTMDAQTYRRMRGRQDVGEKLRAIENVRAAHLNLGLVVTVCQENLSELGRLVDFGCSLVPALKIIVFQPFVPVGRFPGGIGQVTREDVIRSLAESGSKYHLSPSSFFPFLPISAGLSVPHADCSAHAVLSIVGERGYPLPSAQGQTAFFGNRHREALPGRGLLTAEVIPGEIIRAMKSARRQHKSHFLLVSIMAFMQPCTRDEERLSRCIVAMVGEDGITGLCERGCNAACQSRTLLYADEELDRLPTKC